MNYNNEMHKQMESIDEGTKLLLHACCAPCSSKIKTRKITQFISLPQDSTLSSMQKEAMTWKIVNGLANSDEIAYLCTPQTEHIYARRS